MGYVEPATVGYNNWFNLSHNQSISYKLYYINANSRNINKYLTKVV